MNEWREQNPLRSWRHRTKTHATTVASRLDVSNITIMHWEKGDKTPKPENLKAIGRLIGDPKIRLTWARWQANDPRLVEGEGVA